MISSHRKISIRQVLAPIVVAGLVVTIWQAIVSLCDLPKIVVPGPQLVAAALWRIRSDLMIACRTTAFAAFCGLSVSTVFGVLAAFAFSQSRLIRSAFYPYAILLQTVPVIAVAPIVVIAFGRGFFGVTLIAAIISSFPIITSTTTGLLQVDAGLLELFRLHQATRWQTLWKLRLPQAIPYLINGLRISAGAAIVGAIVGEFFVGSGLQGLGVMIERKRGTIRIDELYAAVIVSAVLGVVVFAMISVLGDQFLKRFLGRRLNDS